MKPLPFIYKGYGRTFFRCLAYAEVISHLPRSTGSSGAICGLYLPSAKSQAYYWLGLLNASHHWRFGQSTGSRRHGSAAALLHAQTMHKIPPAAWRLYPISETDQSSPDYRRERRTLAEILLPYRSIAGVSNKNLDFKNAISKPAFEGDASKSCFGIDLDRREEKEFEAAALLQVRADNIP